MPRVRLSAVGWGDARGRGGPGSCLLLPGAGDRSPLARRLIAVPRAYEWHIHVHTSVATSHITIRGPRESRTTQTAPAGPRERPSRRCGKQTIKDSVFKFMVPDVGALGRPRPTNCFVLRAARVPARNSERFGTYGSFSCSMRPEEFRRRPCARRCMRPRCAAARRASRCPRLARGSAARIQAPHAPPSNALAPCREFWRGIRSKSRKGDPRAVLASAATGPERRQAGVVNFKVTRGHFGYLSASRRHRRRIRSRPQPAGQAGAGRGAAALRGMRWLAFGLRTGSLTWRFAGLRQGHPTQRPRPPGQRRRQG
jgi:hypothetical protein